MTVDYIDAELTDAVDEDGENSSDASLISRFENMHRLPYRHRHLFQMAPFLRRYVYDYAMLLEDEDAVATNMVLRNQFVTMSNLTARKPDVKVNPSRKLAPRLEGIPVAQSEDQIYLSKTCEIFLQHTMEQLDWEVQIDAMGQDALTVPLVWAKIIYLEDYLRSPLGGRHGNTLTERQQKYKRLKEDYDDGLFNDHNSQYAEMKRMSDSIKKDMLADIQDELLEEPALQELDTDEEGDEIFVDDPTDERVEIMQRLEGEELLSLDLLPENPYLMGFALDNVLMEDIRWDWSIQRMEDIHKANWIEQRVWMTDEEIREQFNFNEDRMRSLGINRNKSIEGGTSSPDNITDANRNEFHIDVESSNMGTKYAVWERWSKEDGLVYTWVEGDKEFASVIEPPVTSRYWYPFHVLGFNRVTGRFIPVSDVMLSMSLQDEINEKRTFEKQFIRAAMPRYGIAAGMINDHEMWNVSEMPPGSLIQFQRPEIANSVFEFGPIRYDPLLFDATKPRTEMELVTGNSNAALGSTGQSDFATTDAIAAQSMGIQTDRRRKILERFQQQMLRAILDIAVQVIPAENMQSIVGPGYFWPEIDRETMYNDLLTEIVAGSTAATEKQKELTAAIQIGTVAFQHQLPLNGVEYLKWLIMVADDRQPLDKLILPFTPEQQVQIQMARLMNQIGTDPSVPSTNTAAPADPTGVLQGAPGREPFGDTPPEPGSVTGPVQIAA